MRTRNTILSVAIASLFAATPSLAQEKKDEDAQKLGTISITGEGDKLGTGQMIQEEAPKARSTTTRAALDKMRSTANPYQGLALLPGVNTFTSTATVLFASSIAVLGFNSGRLAS